MSLHGTCSCAILPILLLASIAAPAGAAERTGNLQISVWVVDSCASTSAAGATPACTGSAAPIAVLRQVPVADAAAGSQSAAPIGSEHEASGLVTVIY